MDEAGVDVVAAGRVEDLAGEVLVLAAPGDVVVRERDDAVGRDAAAAEELVRVRDVRLMTIISPTAGGGEARLE